MLLSGVMLYAKLKGSKSQVCLFDGDLCIFLWNKVNSQECVVCPVP